MGSQPLATIASELPEGFVRLESLMSDLRIQLYYKSNTNFLGTVVDGYERSTVILTHQAAEALVNANTAFHKDGYEVVVYDTYRPQRAVEHFYRWSQDSTDQKMKPWFYPRIDKSKAFELGYIGRRSGHSRGSTVDLSIIAKGEKCKNITPQQRTLSDGFTFTFLDDGTVDMGSHFDLFDEASWTATILVQPEYQERRQYFKRIMEQYGFKNYRKEWWHFTLNNEPFSDIYHNFPVA